MVFEIKIIVRGSILLEQIFLISFRVTGQKRSHNDISNCFDDLSLKEVLT